VLVLARFIPDSRLFCAVCLTWLAQFWRSCCIDGQDEENVDFHDDVAVDQSDCQLLVSVDHVESHEEEAVEYVDSHELVCDVQVEYQEEVWDVRLEYHEDV
jgi:hypothetical protein